ncbi:MAG TPA: hypothetical protein VMT46_07940 [Anaerolineaceae bacterium]|nr:hypothetical protein [Anaerolineaceae bacterium]
MDIDRKYTLVEAHRQFAKQFNGRVWELIAKEHRSNDEDEEMLHMAYASAFHWRQVGSALHEQRAEWLISRVSAELGLVEPALRHAIRCYDLTREHAGLMEDFDRAYAFEAMARANALVGNQSEARKFIEQAEQAGETILNPEDKEIFKGDLDHGEWFGLR